MATAEQSYLPYVTSGGYPALAVCLASGAQIADLTHVHLEGGFRMMKLTNFKLFVMISEGLAIPGLDASAQPPFAINHNPTDNGIM